MGHRKTRINMQTDKNKEIGKALFERILRGDPTQAGPEGIALFGIGILLKQHEELFKRLGDGDIFSQDIKQFHTKFKETYNGPPRTLPPDYSWRADFMKEELEEYKKAVNNDDMVKQFDALLDLVYVALGTMYLQGFPLLEGWFAVHASNMTKEVVEKGLGKFGTHVSKGDNYVPPQLDGVLDAAKKQANVENIVYAAIPTIMDTVPIRKMDTLDSSEIPH